MAKEIGSKREKKLSISIQDVENTVNEFLEKNDINNKVDEYINSRFDEILNYSEIKYNNELKNDRGYKYQFDLDLFNEFFDFINNLIKQDTQKELIDLEKFPNYAESEEYNRKKMVYDNVFQVIDLTMYSEGIQKMKLIVFHFMLKNLEKRANIVLEDKEVKVIRGYKTPIETFSYEMLQIIAGDDELEKFTLTLRSLIEQWLIKYNNRTKIGQFYYDVLMINPDQVIEKILRYLLFTAIKNVNPITLRAIFSTYITLIHKNIFSFYAMKLQDVKIGYFKQLENIFEDNIINNTHHININEMITQNRLLNFTIKNKRFLKHNYEFLLDEYNSSFFDINYYDFLNSYRKNMNILDYHFYYSKMLKLTNNGFRSNSKLFKLNSNFFKKNNKKSLNLYIKDLVVEKFYNYFYEKFKEKETALTICDNIVQNLLSNINQNNFSTSNFKKISLSIDDYINQLAQLIYSMGKLADD